MLFPFFNGIPSILKCKVTWLLCILNVAIFLSLYHQQITSNDVIEDLYSENYLEMQGELYAQYILEHKKEYTKFYLDLVELSKVSNIEKVKLLGRLAPRDSSFRLNSINYAFKGDQIAVKLWRLKFKKLLNLQKEHPNFKWGFTSLEPKFSKYFSYQFIHGDIMHLLGNMWFLLIVGGLLEPLLGGSLFMLLYLLMGGFAAITYSQVAGLSPIPLVGASGAISGIMSLMIVLCWKQKQNFFYWVLPMNAYWGWVKLPVWIALIMWFIGDLTGLIGNLSEFGGIAYAAHLGGSLMGLTLGLLLKKSFLIKDIVPSKTMLNKA